MVDLFRCDGVRCLMSDVMMSDLLLCNGVRCLMSDVVMSDLLLCSGVRCLMSDVVMSDLLLCSDVPGWYTGGEEKFAGAGVHKFGNRNLKTGATGNFHPADPIKLNASYGTANQTSHQTSAMGQRPAAASDQRLVMNSAEQQIRHHHIRHQRLYYI